MLPTGGPRPRRLAPIVLLLLLLGAARRGVDSSAGDQCCWTNGYVNVTVTP